MTNDRAIDLMDEIHARRSQYNQIKRRVHMIIPSCREGNDWVRYLGEAKAYLELLKASWRIERRTHEC